MSIHKTVIDRDLIESFLKRDFSPSITDLEVINGGEGSQAYSFKIQDEGYIVRVNKHRIDGFKKDQYAYINFGSSLLPIPEIIKIGTFSENLYFCISRKVEGKILDLFNTKELEKISKNLFEVLDQIHAIDVSDKKGYGGWNIDGQAHVSNWKEYLLNVDGYAKGIADTPGLFETTFLEKDFWDPVYEKMTSLISYCPEDRFLVHADYGFNNVLSDGEKITGVIDWENSFYGDFIYDIAWLCFWGENINYKNLYMEYCQAKGIKIQNFEERLLCYMLEIGLGSLSFYSYSNQPEKYKSSKSKLEKLMKL